MWVYDKNAHPINTGQVMGLFVAANPDSSGFYEVQANNSGGTLIAQFATSSTMSESDANALMARMADMLGTVDLTQ